MTRLYKLAGGRDELAKKAETNGTTLSSINTGEELLGDDLAQRIIAALADHNVTFLDLGMPEGRLPPAGPERSALDRLEELEGRVDKLTHAVGETLAALNERVGPVEDLPDQAPPPRSKDESEQAQ